MIASIFKDKHGRVVLWQFPNPPLFAWGLATVANAIAPSRGLAWLAGACLFTWAFMEAYLGVNLFRKLLGIAVLARLIFRHF